jgi:hypothetical protein
VDWRLDITAWSGVHLASPSWRQPPGITASEVKKADVVEHPEVFDHVGLLVNEPSGDLECSLSSHPTTFGPIVQTS